MTCSFCGGVAHPASGCVYGPRTIACGPCTREFWVWVRSHTSKRARAKRRDGSPAIATASSFYEAAGKHEATAARATGVGASAPAPDACQEEIMPYPEVEPTAVATNTTNTDRCVR